MILEQSIESSEIQFPSLWSHNAETVIQKRKDTNGMELTSL